MMDDNNEVGLNDGRPNVYSWPRLPQQKGDTPVAPRYESPPSDRLLLALRRHHDGPRYDLPKELR